MSQPTTWSVPLSGPSTPAAFAQRIDDSLDALLSSHKHTARPSYATAGTIWAKTIDSTETQLYFFDGTDDIYLGKLDLTNNYFLPAASGSVSTADGDEISDMCDGAGVTIAIPKIIEIGDWDMDTYSTKQVLHGLDHTKIIGISSGMIRDDADTMHYPISMANQTGTWTKVYFTDPIDSTKIYLEHGGSFNNTSYDATGYNRGWIVLNTIS